MTKAALIQHVLSLWPGLPFKVFTYSCRLQRSGRCNGAPVVEHKGCNGGRRVYVLRSLACANSLCLGEELCHGRSWSDLANKSQARWQAGKTPFGYSS